MKFIFSIQELIDLYKVGNPNIKNEVIQFSKEVLERNGIVEFNKITNIPPLTTISAKDGLKKIEDSLNEAFMNVENA